MIRILIADDQALVRGAFQVLLDSAPDLEVVGQAGNGAEAVELAAKLAPDVVLMDIRMPVMDGLEGTKRILAGRTRASWCSLRSTWTSTCMPLYVAAQAGSCSRTRCRTS